MPATHTPCIINLDSLENAGTVGFVVLHLTITSLCGISIVLVWVIPKNLQLRMVNRYFIIQVSIKT